MNLNEEWGKKQLVFSKEDLLRALKAFEIEGLEGADCLIFEDSNLIRYRLVGDLENAKFVPMEDY